MEVSLEGAVGEFDDVIDVRGRLGRDKIMKKNRK